LSEKKLPPHWGVVVNRDGDVVDVHSPADECPSDIGSDDGPAKVNSDAYRSGWDSIFGKKSKESLPN